MFPIYLAQPDTTLPAKGTYYIVGKQGLFCRKEMGFYSATVPVRQASFLEAVTPELELRAPKLPADLLIQAHRFFRKVVRERGGGEGILLLAFDPSTQTYTWVCPDQAVHPSGLTYDPPTVGNCLIMGSIHSHPLFFAGHSGTDCKDEEDFDGFHLTMGQVMSPSFSLVISFVVNGSRFSLDPLDVVSGIEKASWAEQLTQPLEETQPEGAVTNVMNLRVQAEERPKHYAWVWSGQEQRFRLRLNDGRDYRSVSVPDEWMPKVVTRPFGSTQNLDPPDPSLVGWEGRP